MFLFLFAPSEKKAAARGAKILDKSFPNWWEKISLGRLRMSEPDTCILGQLYGSYKQGCEELDLKRRERIRNGFLLPDEHHVTRYARLRLAWKTEIEKRLASEHALAS